MKKVIFYSSLVWLLNFSNLKAQCNFNIDSLISDKTQLDLGLNVIQDYQGNFIACGNIRNTNGTANAGYLVKVKFNGDTLWRRKFDFTTNSDVFNDVKEMPDKSYIIAGTSNTVGISNVFLANVDTNGTLVWYKQYTYPEIENANAIRVTPDSKLVVLGYSLNSSQTDGDILLMKTDLSGNLMWRKRIGGTVYKENYTSLQIINNNTEYLLGGTETKPGDSDFGVTKTDTAGNMIWRKLNGSNNFYEKCYSIQKSLDGGYVLGGEINTQARFWKLDTAGAIQWSGAYGLGASTIINEVKQLSDSSYIFISTDSYQHNSSNNKVGYLIKLDKAGNFLWEKYYQRPTTGLNILNFKGFSHTRDNGFIITGYISNVLAPYGNLWLVKTDSLGNDSSTCSIYNGIKELDKDIVSVILYPNPNKGKFKLLINNIPKQGGIINISIYNILGKTISSKMLDSIDNKLVEIEADALFDGIYLVKLTQNNKDIWYSKFVVEK